MPAPNDIYASLSKEQLQVLLVDARGPQRKRIMEAISASSTTTVPVVPPAPPAPVIVPLDQPSGPAQPSADQIAGSFALQILTPEQQTQVSEFMTARAAAQQVQDATQALASATTQVQQAAEAAQAVIASAPTSVDTAALEAAVAVVQPIVDAVSGNSASQ